MKNDANTLPPEERFLKMAHAGRNVFLTGMAGTGKSHLLRQFIQETESGVSDGQIRLGVEPRKIAVTAPTGIAALNINGMTVHRWAGIGIGPAFGQRHMLYAIELQKNPKAWQGARRRITNADILVIDEISMLNGDTFEFLDFWCKLIRDSKKPFGGLQVIVIGDFMQLPPVRTDEKTPYDWAFKTEAWVNGGFEKVELETVKRQDEKDFILALQNFRIGNLGAWHVDKIRQRVVLFPPGDITRIFTHNSQVDRWNMLKLDELPGDVKEYDAITCGSPAGIEYLTRNLLTPQKLQLKIGARVMFTRNEPRGGFVNGMCGVVQDMAENEVIIRANGLDMTIRRSVWRNETESNFAEFHQFPLRLSYAMTIHKSQGLTLDSAYIDIRAAREPGQAYVAISRVKTLAGLYLKEWPTGVWVSNEAREFYQGI